MVIAVADSVYSATISIRLRLITTSNDPHNTKTAMATIRTTASRSRDAVILKQLPKVVISLCVCCFLSVCCWLVFFLDVLKAHSLPVYHDSARRFSYSDGRLVFGHSDNHSPRVGANNSWHFRAHDSADAANGDRERHD